MLPAMAHLMHTSWGVMGLRAIGAETHIWSIQRDQYQNGGI